MSGATSSTKRRWQMWLLWAVVAVVSMLFFLQWTFPYDRVKDRLVDALSEKYNVTVGSVHRGLLPGRMSLRKVALESRPTKPDEVPRVIFIENIDVAVGVFAGLAGIADIGFDVKMAGGTIEGNVAMSKADVALELTGRGVPMASVPGLAEAVGLPLGGKLNTDIKLHLPYTTKGKRALDIPKISGRVGLGCSVGCTVGDGVARVKPGPGGNAKNAIFGADGIVVPQLSIGKFTLEMTFDKGHAKVSKFDLESPDGAADVVLDISLAPIFQDSEVAGCIKFKLSPELKQREEKFGNIQAFIGTPIDKDGYNNIELFRTLRQMGRRPAESCSEGGVAPVNHDDGPGDARPPVRPGLAAGIEPASTTPTPTPVVPQEAPVAPVIDAGTGSTPTGAAADEIKPRASDPASMTAEEAEAARKRAMEDEGIRIEPPPPPPADQPPTDIVQ